jgi:dTDP-4-amino-4,6-dideoxygalactose transaminase
MTKLAIFGGEAVRTSQFPSWPVFDKNEETSLLEVLHSGQWWRFSMGETSGSKVADFQNQFAQAHGARFGVACSTGMAALQIALSALGVQCGDEVILPPYTFIATATAAMAIGATPVFCDINYDTFNLCPKAFEKAITSKTRAVIPVHFAGNAADMESILEISKRHKIAVVEDAAHAHGARWNGMGCGSIGDAGAFSFQFSKNMTSGEGGLITTSNQKVAELCESLIWVGREKGRPWYEHHRMGWNFRLTEFQAALLIEQLKRLDDQNQTRRRNGFYLNEQLSRIRGIKPIHIPDYARECAFHLYIFRFDAEIFGITREEFITALAAEGVPCSAGYSFPLYRNPVFSKLAAEICPNAEKACQQAVWLEQRLLLGTQQDMDDIVSAVTKIYAGQTQFTR